MVSRCISERNLTVLTEMTMNKISLGLHPMQHIFCFIAESRSMTNYYTIESKLSPLQGEGLQKFRIMGQCTLIMTMTGVHHESGKTLRQAGYSAR